MRLSKLKTQETLMIVCNGDSLHFIEKNKVYRPSIGNSWVPEIHNSNSVCDDDDDDDETSFTGPFLLCF